MTDAKVSGSASRISAGAALALTAVALGGFLRLSSFATPGYSLDEDLTALSVAAVHRSGLPLLPSGALNDRGLLYSYLAWFAGLASGDSLNSFRFVSCVSGLLAVAGTYVAARHVVTQTLAGWSCLLLAVFPIHAAISGWGRFYALASAAYAAAIAYSIAPLSSSRTARWYGWMGLTAACQRKSLGLRTRRNRAAHRLPETRVAQG